MKTQKYSVNQHLIGTILAWVNSGEIAIPEIQRPFVWMASASGVGPKQLLEFARKNPKIPLEKRLIDRFLRAKWRL